MENGRSGKAFQTLVCIVKERKYEMKEGLDIVNEKGRITYMAEALCVVTFQMEHCLGHEYRLDTKEVDIALYDQRSSSHDIVIV